MAIGIRTYHRCPYCTRPGGQIAIDTDALVAWGHERPDVDPFYLGETHLDQGVILFDPDRPRGRPCPHLTAGTVNLEFYKVAVDNSVLDMGDLTVDLTNPWFWKHDTQHQLDPFLWIDVLLEENQLLRPRSPHQVDQVDRRFADVVDRVGWIVRAYGTVVSAREPEQFLAELQGSWRKCHPST